MLPLLQFSSSELSPQLLVPSHCKVIGISPHEHLKTSAFSSVMKNKEIKYVTYELSNLQAESSKETPRKPQKEVPRKLQCWNFWFLHYKRMLGLHGSFVKVLIRSPLEASREFLNKSYIKWSKSSFSNKTLKYPIVNEEFQYFVKNFIFSSI